MAAGESDASGGRGKALEDGVVIRTITAFLTLTPDSATHKEMMEKALDFLRNAYQVYSEVGYVVQTIRIATNSFEEWGDDAVVERVRALDEQVAAYAASNTSLPPILLCVGPAMSHDGARIVTDVLLACPSVTATVCVLSREEESDGGIVDESMSDFAATVMTRLASETKGGTGNFNFAALCNVAPCTPFYPAAYAKSDEEGGLAFGIGMQTADMFVSQVCGEVEEGSDEREGLKTAEELRERLGRFQSSLTRACRHIVGLIATNDGLQSVRFCGIDTSLAPAPSAKSLVDGFRACGLTSFASLGSVQIASAITTILQSLPPDIPTIGYRGLMLPPLEDNGLAEAATPEAPARLSLRDLLVLSTVCGIGLDAVPIPGDTPSHAISNLIREVAALSLRHAKKPLSVRLFPVPGCIAGELGVIDNPYLCACPVFPFE